MKIKHNILLVIIMLLSFIVLASCNNGFGLFSHHAPEKYKIKLEIDSLSGKLKVKTLPHGNCVGNGCIVVARGDEAQITFQLIRSSDWYFTEFKICQGDTKPVSCSLEDWQLSQFEVTTNAAGFPKLDGIIKLAFADELMKFMVHDYNGPAQDYFYSITACKKLEDKLTCSTTDPQIDHKGRN